MRNFFHFNPNFNTFNSWHPVNFVSQVFHNFHARHILDDIAAFDEHELRDMGICRADLEIAKHASLKYDPLEILHDAQLHHFEDNDLSDNPPDPSGLRHTSLRSKI